MSDNITRRFGLQRTPSGGRVNTPQSPESAVAPSGQVPPPPPSYGGGSAQGSGPLPTPYVPSGSEERQFFMWLAANWSAISPTAVGGSPGDLALMGALNFLRLAPFAQYARAQSFLGSQTAFDAGFPRGTRAVNQLVEAARTYADLSSKPNQRFEAEASLAARLLAHLRNHGARIVDVRDLAVLALDQKVRAFQMMFPGTPDANAAGLAGGVDRYVEAATIRSASPGLSRPGLRVRASGEVDVAASGCGCVDTALVPYTAPSAQITTPTTPVNSVTPAPAAPGMSPNTKAALWAGAGVVAVATAAYFALREDKKNPTYGFAPPADAAARKKKYEQWGVPYPNRPPPF